MAEVVCPKCGKEEFLVRMFVDMTINPDTNFGTIKYDWIEKVTCAQIKCGYDLKDDVDEEIRMGIIGIAKRILATMRAETLMIK